MDHQGSDNRQKSTHFQCQSFLYSPEHSLSPENFLVCQVAYSDIPKEAIEVIKWQSQEEKTWEFKFQNPDISNEWYRYIFKTLNSSLQKISPQKQQEEKKNKNINYQKLNSVSRFDNLNSSPNNNANSPNQNEGQQLKQQYLPNQLPMTSQSNTRNIANPDRQHEYRFKDFQRENNLVFQSKPAPIITTFRQRFPDNTIFNSVRRSLSEKSDQDNGKNWNAIWFQAIQTAHQHVRIDIYNDFLMTCEKFCKEILKESTMLKHKRHHVPVKISSSEEVYNFANITYHFIIEKDLQNSETQLCSNYLLQQFKKQQENYTFILKATKNKGLIKVPLSCIFSYQGFNFYCEANIPSNFTEVSHSDKYIFHSQFQRLEEQLKLRISLAHFSIFTNKLSSIVESQAKRTHFLIIKDIKKILHESIIQGSNIFTLSKDFFFKSNVIYPKDYDFSQERAKSISQFLKAQNEQCTIISYEDLKQNLQKSNLPYQSISQLLIKCQNRYLSKIIISEFAAEIFCHIVRTEMMIFIKKWNKDIETMRTDETPDYEDYIFRLLSQFLSENINSNIRFWNIISNQIFQKFQLNVKQEQIIIGYLLSSISFKLGVELDFQLLILQRNNYFNQGILISPQVVKSFEPLFGNYADEDMCDSFETMMHQIQNHTGQDTLENVARFYRLKQQNAQHIEPLHWRKICKLFSFYVPYENEEDYSYLSIYSCLSLLYLDYNSFCILISAVKWLFHAKRVDDALQFIYFFKDISWFWVSDANPFMIVLYEIVAEYFRISGNLLASIDYFSKCNEEFDLIVKGNTELDNLNRNKRLAEIFMTCNMHKESLKKYVEVKRILRKTDKDSVAISDVLVQISKLYLHLGDIENCSKSCKQSIEFSTFNPFQNELQEFQMYSILIRSLQIKEDYSKYKFYVDIIQEKFKHTKNPIILQNILRLTIEQALQKFKKYNLKKFSSILYYYEATITPSDEQLSVIQHFRRLIKHIGAQQPCRMLRNCMENHLQIADLLMEKESAQAPSSNQQLSRMENLLRLLCSFIGFEYIFATVLNNLKKK